MNHLKPNEIVAALSGIDENSNLWRAFMSIIEGCKQAELGDVCDRTLNDTQSHFVRGRFAMVYDMESAAESFMRDAQKIRLETDRTK